MASVINTNIASINAQRSLARSTQSLNKSIQRESSGLRISSAKDDAAGLAIADRMTARLKGQAVAQRNANDAISLAQTAEGVLSTVADNLQRMRELAVQAANGTDNTQDRATLNAEYRQLSDEISRVLNGASFNGQSLFTGNGGSVVSTDGTGQVQMSADLTLTFQVGENVLDHKLNDQISISLSDLSHNEAITNITGASAHGLIGLGDTSRLEAAQALYTSSKTSLDQLFATGGSLSQDELVASAAILQYYVERDRLDLDRVAADPVTQSDAQKAIKDLDRAVDLVSSKRAEFGALQNRFSAVIGNLQIFGENTAASRSRIMDADYASETRDITRAQILQQAATAMLSQANGTAQSVLYLMK